MSRFSNARKQGFLASIPQVSLEGEDNDHAARCKFNFSYFCRDPAGQDFAQWTHEQLAELLNKLVHYSKETLDHWQHQRVGKHGHVLEIYGAFPARSDFQLPRHVPHQVQWGRFRLEWDARLCGFVVPQKYENRAAANGHRFCTNTFYVVFLDQHHAFYKAA